MTSIRQIEANRRNARQSTGPTTATGKEHSRCNALRHGLTAETVIGALEDAEDYQAFEAAVAADYDVETAVERELVLRLASVLWRLRRATTIETQLFEIQAEHLREFRANRPVAPGSGKIVYALLGRSESAALSSEAGGNAGKIAPRSCPGETVSSAADLARCFLRLANLPTFPLDWLSRYEVNLWRQAGQIVFALEALRRRTSQQTARRHERGSWRAFPGQQPA